jgi:hypothetical protein
MPSAISAARDISESMLATRFEFAPAIVAPPPSLGPTFLKMDVAHALAPAMLPFVFVFLLCSRSMRSANSLACASKRV